jgi:multimeric flavodoxin WrbA
MQKPEAVKRRPVVLAISGSQRAKSFTERMLDTLIGGMGEVELHKFYPHKMKIGSCTSCWSCWVGKNRGECTQRDDFQGIYDVYKRCDYLLVAAPVYAFGFPATVKNVIDRFFVNLDPLQIDMGDGLTAHSHRFNPAAKGVLVSSCGFPDMENFSLMSAHFKKWMRHAGLTWCGEVLIPAAGAVNVPGLFDDNMEAIRKAGAELAGGTINGETMGAISDVGISTEDYRDMVNASFEGGVVGRAKAAAIGLKALREKAAKKNTSKK